MTFWRTLEYTLICMLLFSVILSLSFMEIRTFFIIVSLLAGLVFYYLFKEMPIDEAMQEISIAYIPASIVVISEGMLTNLMKYTIETAASLRPDPQIGSLATIFAQRNIIFELIVLLVGLFGPFVLFKLFKGQQIEYKRLIWNIASVFIVYLIALLIVTFVIMPRLIGGAPL